jgi:seryl-tRNA(sec) selenium transferase
MNPLEHELLRRLPSVDEVVNRISASFPRVPRRVLVEETRRVLNATRAAIRQGQSTEDVDIDLRVRAALEDLLTPSLRGVINATGVVLHTNLGRAPLPQPDFIHGYCNLEYDLKSGKRGKRDVHISGLLERILGTPGIAVNNNAAAVWLVLNELAAGHEVIISRGELIEIGDGFRIPDIMQRSGAILREVGTTNRTRIEDYRAAIDERTKLLMRVHRSNFHISGFTGRPELEELVALGREYNLPVYEDLGSGCLTDLSRFGIREPLVTNSLRAGVRLVSFSGDKLLGGPQAGIIAGDPELVTRLRRNPMFRALRLDKLIYQMLEMVLRSLWLEQWHEIPIFRMFMESPDDIRARAERMAASLQGKKVDVIPGWSVAGGGSIPEQSIPTWLIAITGPVVAMERRLRSNDPPVIARIEGDRLLIDLRTVLPEQESVLRMALLAA